MARTRSIIVAMLAISVLAVGCGGDESAEEGPQATEPEVTTSDEPTTASDSTEPAEQAAPAPAEPEPAPARLGDRFPWCADAQVTWDYLAETSAQLEAAETTLQEAQGAVDSASDDLDRAEAGQALEAASAAHADAALRVQGANRSVSWLINPDRDLSDDTEAIAFQRAETAWRASADPAVVELHDFLRDPGPAEPWPEEPPPLEPHGGWTIDEVVAALERVQSDIVESSQVIVSLLWDLDASIAAIGDADAPGAALAAYQRFIDTAHALEIAHPRYRAAAYEWTIQAPANVLNDERVQAAIQSVRAPDVRDDIPAWVAELPHKIHSSPFAPNVSSTGRNRAEDAAKSAAAAFMAADASGMAALQESLTESCQP